MRQSELELQAQGALDLLDEDYIEIEVYKAVNDTMEALLAKIRRLEEKVSELTPADEYDDLSVNDLYKWGHR